MLQERPDDVRDLFVAVLADDQAVMGVRPERVILGAQPLGQALALRAREHPVDAGADDLDGQPVESRPVDGHSLQHLPSRGTALGPHQVLDPQHVCHGQVRVLALDLLGGACPADELPAEARRDEAHHV